MGTHPIFESDFDCLTDKSKKTWISSLSVNMTDLNRIEVVAVVLQKSAISDKFILPLVQDPSIMNSIQHNLKKKPVASFLGKINTTSS